MQQGPQNTLTWVTGCGEHQGPVGRNEEWHPLVPECDAGTDECGSWQDLYLAGRLHPKKGHFQIDADGSSSIHEDGVHLVRLGKLLSALKETLRQSEN